MSLFLLIVPAFPIGILVGAYPGYKAYQFVWKDARFCTSCHVHDYATFSWKGSAHGKLTTCHDCHHQPLHAYMMEPIILAIEHTQFPRDLKHTPHVPADLCESCHVSGAHTSTVTGPFEKEDIRKVPKIDNLYLHRVHMDAKTEHPIFHDTEIKTSIKDVQNFLLGPQEVLPNGAKRNITCTDCHGGPTNRAHNFRASELSCVRCHQTQHKTKVAATHGCRSCHFQEFVTPIAPNPHQAPTKED